MKIIYHRPWVIVTRWRFSQWGIDIRPRPVHSGWKRHLRINLGTLSVSVPLWG